MENRHDALYDYLYYQPWFSSINTLYYQIEISDDLNTVFYKNTAGEIEARNAAERINLTAEQRKNTRPDIDREDVVFADSEVSFSAQGEYDGEKESIHSQIRQSQDKLNAMNVVFKSVVPTKVGKAHDAGTWAISELKQYGFQADRQGFGKIEFDEKSIRDAMKYLDTDAEKISIVAIYKVLKQGIQIGEHGNHKERGKHTVTFAAPIELNGIRGNMAVVVNMRNNKYKVHRILLPQGQMFSFINKNAEQEMQRGVPKRSLANATSSASDKSISQENNIVNTSDKKISTDPEASFSYTPDDEQELTRMARDGEITAEEYGRRMLEIKESKSADDLYSIARMTPEDMNRPKQDSIKIFQ